MKLRKKYKKEKDELIQELIKKGIKTAVLSITFKGMSKMEDHKIYECEFLDNSKVKEVPIIAIDVTQALAKLEAYVDLGIPQQTLKQMLGSERFVG